MSNVDQSQSTSTPSASAEVEPRKRKRRHLGGSTIEAALGLGAMLLAILALAGLLVMPFAAIAIIAAGTALLFEGAAVAAETRAHGGTPSVVGGFGAESLAGVGAVTLGILALIGISPMTLLPVAAIVLGAGMLIAGGTSSETGTAARLETPFAASGVHTLVGAGAVVLGILGLLGNAPIVLTLVAILCVGTGLLLSGAAVGGRMIAMFNRAH